MRSFVIPSVILGVALIITSLILGDFFIESRKANRKVSVKGLSERSVVADQGWWAIHTMFGGSSVQAVRGTINESIETINGFLKEQGFSDNEISTGVLKIYQNNYNSSIHPYNGELSIEVSTDDVEKLVAASNATGKLIERGILITGDKWNSGPKYFYTKFTDIKPEMLAEATMEAKKAAEEFAKNADTEVGTIAYANQGVIRILPGNRTNEDEIFYREKLIRVVTTVDYFLK